MSDVLCPPAGFYPSVPFETYQSWNAINSGAVSAMMLSPKHGRLYLDGGLDRKDSDDMRFGRQLHLLLLEPDRAAESLVVSEPCSSVLKSGDRKGEMCGQTASYTNGFDWRCGQHLMPCYERSTDHLSKAEYHRALKMIESLRSSEANNLLKGAGWTETSMVYEWNGITFKCRLDRLRGDNRMIIDLKKMRGGAGALHECQWAIAKRGYHRQAAIYHRGNEILSGQDADVAWVFLEDSPPFDVQVVFATTADLQCGWDEVEHAVMRFEACRKAGKYAGYIADPKDIKAGALPESYLKTHERNHRGAEDTYGDVSGGTGRADRADGVERIDGDYCGAAAASGGDDEWSRYVAEHS